MPAETRGDDAPARLTGGISEIGGFGTTYLVGLLGLSVVVGLALRGAPAVRQHARLAGLGLAGGRARGARRDRRLARTAGPAHPVLRRRAAPGGRARTRPGQRVRRRRAAGGRAAPGGRAAGGTPADGEPDEDRPDRRRRADEEDVPPAPADLTVQPTVPFAGPERSY
nr:hypothetical protein [Micromonospora provocatoris]